MAVSTNCSFLFLLFLVFSLKIQARAVRESHFFNKAVRENNVNEPETFDKQQLPFPQQEEPTTFTAQQSENGYGLYGNNRYNQDSPTTTTTTTNNNVEYNARHLPSKYPTEEYTGGVSYEKKDSTATTVYPNTQYEDKRYGMSDTRFLENGRYFYDLNAENNRNGYGSTRGNNNNMGYYGSSSRFDPMSKYNYGGYYGNNENSHQYDNSMEDRFRNRQETEDDFEP